MKSYQGTIIENSLLNKSVLKDLNILKTYQMEDWLLHDVLVNEEQVEKLGKFLRDGPWYMHFWEDNRDDIVVVFKDKNFRIKHSNRETWREAIEHGKTIGIPEEQLDFLVG